MKRSKKLLSLCLAALLAGSVGLPVGAVAAKAPSFSDTRGHWARDYIQSGVSRGYISGYENGTFKPDSPVTRAEFCKMANNALGVTQTASISFRDVSSADWYYSEVRKAVAAGYITGYEDGTFQPNAYINRQEAAVVLSRVVSPPASDRNLYDFRDSGSIDTWAQPGARMVYTKNYMAGDEYKNFNPRGNLTRGESAKIVEALLGGETVVKSDVTVSSPQALSNSLYIGNVTLASGLGSGEVTLRNCRVLGTLTVSGGGTVNLSHSGVNKMVVNRTGGAPEITANGNSSVRQTTVNGGCSLVESSLNGSGFGDVTLSGSNLKNNDVYLSGSFDTVSLSSPARLSLTKGTIDSLSLASGAAGSLVNLANNTRVSAATIAGSADFTGTGRITKASITASNVTFETPPDDGSGYQIMTPAVTPKNGAVEVAVNTKITLAFSETIKTDGNKDLTRSYVESDVVELRAGKENGTSVSFTAALSNSNRTITLTPDDTLDKSTTYYVILLKNALRNTAGTYNARQVYTFSTVGGLTPVTNPVDGSNTIPVGTNITLTFGDTMVRGDTYGSISSDYLKNSCFDLTRSSIGGRSVSFTATISSDRKTITIDPVDDLDTGTRYYVSIRKNSLANSGRGMVKEQSFYFNTADSSVLVPVMDPPTGSDDVERWPTLKLTFNEQLFTYSGDTSFSTSDLTDAFTLYRGSNTSSNRVGLDVTISNRRVITIVPQDALRANATYTLELKRNSFSDRASSSGRNSNSGMIFTFTTGSETVTGNLIPKALPGNGATGVATVSGGPIRLVFDSNLYNASGGSLSTSYLRNTVLELREESSTGRTVGFDAVLDGRVVTLTPTGSLKSSTRYYVIVNADTLRNSSSSSSGKTNSKFTTYFTTGSSSTALQATSPHNGAVNVSPTGDLVLDYSTAVYNNIGDSLSSSYMRGAVKLYRGTSESSSNAISFSGGNISSNRTLTLTPGSTLQDNTTYLVVIPAGSFTNASGVPNTKQSFTFTVGSGIAIVMTAPANNATNVGRTDSITLTFDESVRLPGGGGTPDTTYLTNNIKMYRGSNSGTPVTCSVVLSNRTVTLTPSSPLDAGVTYYVVIDAGRFTGTSRGNNTRFQASFTTTSAAVKAAVASSTPSLGATVAVPNAVVLNFSTDLTQGTDGGTVTQAYLDSLKTESKLTLKADNAAIDFGVSLSGTRQLTLTPKVPLLPGTSYTVDLSAGSFQSGTLGTVSRNEAYRLTFKTNTPVVTLQLRAGKVYLEATVTYDYRPDELKIELVEKGKSNWETVYQMQPMSDTSYKHTEVSLTEGTDYNVKITYTYGNGKTIIQEKTVTTESTSQDATLEELVVTIPQKGTARMPADQRHDGIISGDVVSIGYKTKHPKATVEVVGATAIGDGTFQVTSDVPATKEVAITVTAEDKITTKTYTVTLVWEAPPILDGE